MQTWTPRGSQKFFLVPHGNKHALLPVVKMAFQEPLELDRPGGGVMMKKQKELFEIIGPPPTSNPSHN